MKPKYRQSGADLLRHLVLAWLIAVTLEYLRLEPAARDLQNAASLEGMTPGRILTVLFAVTALLLVLGAHRDIRRPERWAMALTFGALAFASLSASFSWSFFAVCLLIAAGLAVFGLYGWNRRREESPYLFITAILAAAFFLFVSLWTVTRYLSFSSSTYDLGIFSQMFHYMKTTGAPMTTLERDGLLSHFSVHMSPIYYLLLPFYVLAPSPVTLQLLQAAVVTSAVIPLWLICGRRNLPDWQKMLLSLLLLLFPAFSGGTGYDIHENCFLTPLLLWLFYSLERKSIRLTALFALLTLMVKEDAAVYVAVVGLFVLTDALLRKESWRSREILTGVILTAAALVWFFAATWYLRNKGDGVMTYRYGNFFHHGSSSLTSVITAVLLNPMKAVYECVDPEKLRYITLTLLPLLGMPLITRKYQRYLLLIPYVLVNLMSDYAYQHDIFFQYSFGSTAFLFYLTALNLSDLRIGWHRTALLSGAVLLSAACFISAVFPRAEYYPNRYQEEKARFTQTREILDTIPEDAAVTAAGFYTPYLSGRDILYDVQYASRDHILSTDYVLIEAGDGYKTWSPEGVETKEELISLLNTEGYTAVNSIPEVFTLYYRETAG